MLYILPDLPVSNIRPRGRVRIHMQKVYYRSWLKIVIRSRIKVLRAGYGQNTIDNDKHSQ